MATQIYVSIVSDYDLDQVINDNNVDLDLCRRIMIEIQIFHELIELKNIGIVIWWHRYIALKLCPHMAILMN